MQTSLIKQIITSLGYPKIAFKMSVAGRQKRIYQSTLVSKLFAAASILMLSVNASAVGMGGINVASALGQPLKAEIELVAVNKTEKTSLVVRLASPDAYKGAGLEYPQGNKFKFQVESRANGELYLKVSSEQPVSDPFVSMLVELSWASGRLLREYTFLLDPPGYIAEQPKQEEVQPVAPLVQSAPLEIVASPAGQPAPAVAPVQESKPAESKPVESKPAEKHPMVVTTRQAAAAPAEKQVATGNITVQNGDTLNKIADQNKPAEVSLERMLVALYRANAEQFDGGNMNRIRAGKILRLPEQNELTAVAQSDAAKEIRAQTADWNAYRQKLAGAATVSSQPQEGKQVATGKIASSVADKAPVAKESAKEMLKLSRGEAPGDKAGAGAGGKQLSAQDKKNAEREDAIAKAKTAKEEQMRTALLEKNLKDMQRLAQLKAETAALLKSSGGASAVVAAPPVVAAASGVKPVPAAKPKPKVVVQEPSLVDQILQEPLYLGIGAAALLGLGGIVILLGRRRRASAASAAVSSNKEDTSVLTGRITAPVVPSPDTGDFTKVAAVTATVDESTEQAETDPISEADLFLNFGRDVQAEEILRDALQHTPGDHRIHLKLLGIYANRKDANSFSSIARQLQNSGDEEAWQQAAEMGHKLEPGNPMYGAVAGDAGSTVTLDATPDFVLDNAPTEQESLTADLDIDLGDAEKTAILTPDDMTTVQAESMDFDITPANNSAVAPMEMDFDITSTESSTATPDEIDFDVTSAGSSLSEEETQAEEEEADLDDLVFDVSSTNSSEPEIQAETHDPIGMGEPEKEEHSDEDGMAFTLDFPVDEAPEKPLAEAQPAEIGLGDINLNFDEAAPPVEPMSVDSTPEVPAPEVKDEHWHEVATKLDLAKAYQEMGDAVGAREILEEVLREGDEEQQEAAQSVLNQIG